MNRFEGQPVSADQLAYRRAGPVLAQESVAERIGCALVRSGWSSCLAQNPASLLLLALLRPPVLEFIWPTQPLSSAW